MGESSPPLQTVYRGFEVLEHLWEMNGAGVTELSERMDLPDSTVHDYLRSLAATEFVTREKGEYHLSYKVFTMGGKLRHQNRLFQIAKPEVEALAAETDEYVGLNVEENGQSLILHQETGDQALDLGTYPGMLTPLHAHAGGKVLLAHFPEQRVDEIIETRGLPRRTEHTITDPAALKDELKTVRANGHAIDWDEQVIGMGMIAVPLLIDDRVLGGLAVLCPTGRLQNESYQEELLGELRSAANTVTVNYRYGT